LKNRQLKESTRHNLSEARRKIAANSLSNDQIENFDENTNAFHVKVPTNIVLNESSAWDHGRNSHGNSKRSPINNNSI
jgi:hypothetical protein